jgi:hypothetical protein
MDYFYLRLISEWMHSWSLDDHQHYISERQVELLLISSFVPENTGDGGVRTCIVTRGSRLMVSPAWTTPNGTPVFV